LYARGTRLRARLTSFFWATYGLSSINNRSRRRPVIYRRIFFWLSVCDSDWVGRVCRCFGRFGSSPWARASNALVLRRSRNRSELRSSLGLCQSGSGALVDGRAVRRVTLPLDGCSPRVVSRQEVCRPGRELTSQRRGRPRARASGKTKAPVSRRAVCCRYVRRAS